MHSRLIRSRLTALALAACMLFAMASASPPTVTAEPAARAEPAAAVPPLVETPSLKARVMAGSLAPVAKRIPDRPLRITVARHGTPGRRGGRMRWLMAREKDVRMVVYYSYARLVCFNRDLKLAPDILADFEVEDGRRFTLKLRPGHRWSDGHPFTSADFAYWWNAVANHPELGNGNFPATLLVNGQPPKFEVIDKHTVRYTWDGPNPSFLPALAGTLPLTIAMPAHYLKPFHADYADPKALAKRVAQAKTRSWTSLHRRKSRASRPLEPDLPVLDPWTNTTRPPSSVMVFKRNPYFHRIDENGRQLPYIDEIELSFGSSSLIPAKTGAGDSDLQGRYLSFNDYTFLKTAEDRAQVDVLLWLRGVGSQVALLPNLNTSDATWRKLWRNVTVRRALSLAVNRNEINEAIYYGLAQPSGDTVLPMSPLFKPRYRDAWTAYDPQRANAMLDAAGLSKRDYDGIRRLPDGRRAELTVETAGESTEQADVLSLIKDYFRDIGIAMFTRATQRDLLRNRVFSGSTVMSVWSGHDNAMPSAAMSPASFAPTAQSQLQWASWGQHHATGGMAGEPPDLPAVQKLLDHYKAWRQSKNDAQRRAAWHKILALYADQVFTIGTVNRAKQPIVRSVNLRNIPDTGIFTFDPTAYFGVYRPETFWFDTKATAQAASDSAAVTGTRPASPRTGAN